MNEPPLSKSRLAAFRQCPRRLWLEVHRPELRETAGVAGFRQLAGHHVGDVARRLYDTDGDATLIEPSVTGIGAALRQTRTLLERRQPIFEAGLEGGGGLAFADVMLPTGSDAWRMIEIKSSTQVKDHHVEDIAIQTFIAERAGVRLASVAIACIDSSWTYPGDGDYVGLLYETDLTETATQRMAEVEAWVGQAREVAARQDEPVLPTGRHCHSPFPCPFHSHCSAGEPQPEYPSAWLPRVQARALREHIEGGAVDMRDVPDDLLNARQRLVKQVTLANRPYVDHEAAAAELAAHSLPAYFLDFETVQFAVPIWPDTRPYEQIPFQFSLHRLSRTGRLSHTSYLNLDGEDPSHELAVSLLDAAGRSGPVYVYNASFERACINALAERFPPIAPQLVALAGRLVDLWPVVGQHYYHPRQQGSWSLKYVLPTIAPDLAYDALTGVQDGGMAMVAYLEAIQPETSSDRHAQIEKELFEYCRLDTLGLVRVWSFLSATTVAD